jgi:uncharacterized protein YdiU (UPF0061 family)
VFRAKLGLTSAQEGDGDLIDGLMHVMAASGADFTNCFRGLADGTARNWVTDLAAFDAWAVGWQARRACDGSPAEDQEALMRASNPAVIPRNHQLEAAIQAAVSGNYEPFFTLNRVLATPFDLSAEDADFAKPPTPDEIVQATFCGT